MMPNEGSSDSGAPYELSSFTGVACTGTALPMIVLSSARPIGYCKDARLDIDAYFAGSRVVAGLS